MARNAHIPLHPDIACRLMHFPLLHISIRKKPPLDLYHVTIPTPAFAGNKRNTQPIVLFGYYLAPFIASQGAVAVWSVIRAWSWDTNHCGAGLVRARFGRGEGAVDRFEEGPETWEAGAYDTESKFGVGPDACGCVVPFLDSIC